MENTAWKLAKQIFHDALQESGRERVRFVEETCGEDPELLAQVMGLLQAHEDAGDFLSEGALAAAALETGFLLVDADSGSLPDPASDGPYSGRDLESGGSPPARIGPYEILGVLGVGGMGTVYRARDPDLARDLAIKVLPDDLVSGTQLARFEQEAKLLASLNHPNIATIHAIGETDGRPYLVLELIEGESLSQHITGGPLPVEEAVDLGRQVARAIEAAHEAGIVHRDLKPANVMITARGLVKILDFGISKVAGPGAPAAEGMEMTGQGILLGTVPYMSPEQIGGNEVDERSDLWALGCLLYETLTGGSPFERSTSALTFVAIQKEEPDLTALPKGTPEALRELITGCLDKDPEGRPASAAVVLRSLSDTLTGLRSSAPSAWSRMTPMGRGVWVAVGVLATIMVLALVDGTVLGAFLDSLRPRARVLVTDGGRLAAVVLVVLLLGYRALTSGGPGLIRRRVRRAAIGMVTVAGLALLYKLGSGLPVELPTLGSGALDVYVSLPFQGVDDEESKELLDIAETYRRTLADVFEGVESVNIMPEAYDSLVLEAFPAECTYRNAEVWMLGSGLTPYLVLCNQVNIFSDTAGGTGYSVVSSLQRARGRELEFVDQIPALGSNEEIRFLALWTSAQIVRTMQRKRLHELTLEHEEVVSARILGEYSKFLLFKGETASEVARMVEGPREEPPGEGGSPIQKAIDVLALYQSGVSLEEDGERHRRIRDATLQRVMGSKR